MSATRRSPRAPVRARTQVRAAGRARASRDHSRQDTVALVLLVAVPLTVAARAVLPAKYSFDADAIRRIAIGSYLPLEDPSFVHVGYLYRFLGLGRSPVGAGILGMVLALTALGCALRTVRGPMRRPEVLLIGFSVLTSAVYLSTYSKDVWVLPVVIVVLLAPPGLRGELAIIAVVCVYAYYLRTYWFLVLLLYLGLRVVSWRSLSRRTVLAVLAGAVVVVSLAAPLVLGEDIQSIRESVNVDRVDTGDAVTAIQTPGLGSSPPAAVLENLLVVAELVVPLPLVALGSPQYAVFALVIVGIWWFFGRRVLTGDDRVLDGGPARAADERVVRCTLLVLAYLTTQALFEPDYGSYLRHLTPLLPLVITVVAARPRQTATVSTTSVARP